MALLDKIRTRANLLSQFSDGYGYLVYPELKGPIKNRMMFQGKEVIVWSLNDYLGLSCDERVIQVETEAVSRYGISYPGGSRMLSGNTAYHEQLESQLEKMTGKKAMLLNLVYAGSISILQALVDRNDIVLYDQEVHASIIDGIKSHTGMRYSFKHNNIDHLQHLLAKANNSRKINSEIVIVVDGVFSMTGHLSKLEDIVKLKNDYDFTLIVDDSHGFLVFAEGSSPDHFTLMEDVDIYISSFGKALGNVGGFVCANRDFIDYFKYSLRSQVFGRSLSIINVISSLYKIEILNGDTEVRGKLWKNTHMLQNGLRSIGFDIGDTMSPITPIYLKGDGETAAKVMHLLRDEFNLFCSGVTYPVTPKNTTLLRLIPTALHTDHDIDYTLDSFYSIKRNSEKEFSNEDQYVAETLI